MILVNHIGTSVLESVENELMALVEDVKAATGSEVLLTFNSKRAVEKLTAKGYEIKQTLDLVDSYEDVTILPVHLIGGKDLELLKSQTSVTILPPLLASLEDCKILANVLKNIMNPNKHTLLVGHGSADSSHDMYQTLEGALKDLNLDVTVLTLNDDPESFSGPKEVDLMPLFTVAGHHVHKDLFETPTSFKCQLLSKGYSVTTYEKGLLSYESIRQLYINKLVR